MKTTLGSALAALFLVSASASAAPASVDGAWTAKVPSPNGQAKLDVVFTLKVDGGKLTGTASAGGEVYKLVDTKITGDAIEFRVEGERALYSGVVAGNEIAMKVTFKSNENGNRTWSFVAKRPETGRAALQE